MRNSWRGLTLACGVALLSACAVGPDYKRPQIQAAASFKEEEGWKPSEPADALERGPWWQIFNDEVLNGLQEQLNISNENVKAAAAAVEQARALVSEAKAGYWPTVNLSTGAQRGAIGAAPARGTYSAGVNGTWGIDIWGQVRRSVEGDRASAQASQAALAVVRLAAQVDLAAAYFELRGQDQLQNLLNDVVAAQEASLKIAENRYKFGVAARADVVSARTQLLSSQAQQVNAAIQRGVLEHAVAVLIGKQPAEFSLAPTSLRADVPTVPAGLPSSLLERRPDIAEAERRVAAANAQIGVARAAFFPSLSLGGSDEYTGGSFSKLITLPNRIWAVGPTLAQTLFAGGLRRAQAAQAHAAYESSVDNYRQAVLTGFQQVEDQMITLRVLSQQATLEEQLVLAAREAETLTLNQYKAGTVPYSSVIAAQTTRLNSEQSALNVLVSRLTSSVNMIQALGGGWHSGELSD